MKSTVRILLNAAFVGTAALSVAGCSSSGSSAPAPTFASAPPPPRVTPAPTPPTPPTQPRTGRIADSAVNIVSRRTRTTANGAETNVIARGAAGGSDGLLTATGDRATLASTSLVRRATGTFNPALSGTAGDFTVTAFSSDNAALSVVDSEYARFGVAAVTDQQTGVLNVGYFSGANADNVPRGTPVTGGAATYRGPAAGQVVIGSDELLVNGTTTLTADFTDGTIKGEIDNVVDSNGTALGTDLLLNGDITGVDYAGTVQAVDSRSGVSVVDTTNGRNSFQGGFYGPQAEETAGTIDVQGTNADGQSVDFIGAFQGAR